MSGWLGGLDEGQRRLLATLAALVGVLALVVGGLVLTGDDDPGAAAVQTEDATTTTRPVTTSSSARGSSTTTTVDDPSTTTSRAPAAGSGRTTTTTTRRPGGGSGGPSTTRPSTVPPTTTTTAPPSGGACATGGGSAGQMATLFCSHRADLGLPSMSRNGSLDAMAQEWAQKMANDGQLSHRPNAQASAMVAARCACPGWAENVAFDETVGETWDGWLASSSHRTNIENPHDGEYGLGVVSAGRLPLVRPGIRLLRVALRS